MLRSEPAAGGSTTKKPVIGFRVYRVYRAYRVYRVYRVQGLGAFWVGPLRKRIPGSRLCAMSA